MADPAGLGEDLPAQFLRGGQSVVGGGLLRRSVSRRQQPKSSTPKRTAERTAERIAALRFILNPPDIFFCKPTPAQCQAEGLDPEPGGVTGMRSGGASATICGWATRATGRRSVMPTQPFQKDGSLIKLAQEIGADTLSIVRADADEGRRAKQSLKTG